MANRIVLNETSYFGWGSREVLVNEKTGVVKELRARQQFDKPSVVKRLQREHAVYVQRMRDAEE